MISYKNVFTNHIHQLQDHICTTIEQLDGIATFREDMWEREGGGGGKSRVIENGSAIEKGGVNTSIVHGTLPPAMQKHMNIEEGNFFACGLSIVIHPLNPMAPTAHANIRYFELYRDGEVIDRWFGGGMDMTPYYIFEEDAVHFHQTIQNICTPFGADIFPKYKERCDEYFFNTHRNEHRGIGGIFFDYLRGDDQMSIEQAAQFTMDIGSGFTEAYAPILEKRINMPHTKENIDWQQIRRGRYVEFNLLHDRGTLFGLKTKGRIESILMSLPPTVQWKYDHHPLPDSHEARTLAALKPQNWAQNINV